MKKPPEPTASQAGYRRPDYVIETWVSDQLRDRIQRRGPSLDEALRTTNPPERASEPEPEPNRDHWSGGQAMTATGGQSRISRKERVARAAAGISARYPEPQSSRAEWKPLAAWCAQL